MADILREPLYVRPLPRGFISTAVVPNLLLTTLVVTAASPFKQTDWPPPQPRKIVQSEVVPNVLIGTLSIVNSAIPASVDWQNNAVRKYLPQSQDVPNLLSSTLLATAPPFRPVDLSVAYKRGFTQVHDKGSQLTIGLPRLPFTQTDWQPPQYLKRINQDIPPNTISLLQMQVSAPFRSVDLQNAFRAKVVYADPVPNQLARGIPPPPPFRQTDWQTLKTSKPVVLVNDPPNLIVNTLFAPPVVLPFRQSQWPTPYRARIGNDIAWRNSILPLGIGPVIPPLLYTPADVLVIAFRRGYFAGRLVEVGTSITITTPYQYTPYWMSITNLATVPDDWNALLEVFSEEIDTQIIRPQTASDVADILAQDPGPYRST